VELNQHLVSENMDLKRSISHGSHTSNSLKSAKSVATASTSDEEGLGARGSNCTEAGWHEGSLKEEGLMKCQQTETQGEDVLRSKSETINRGQNLIDFGNEEVLSLCEHDENL